MIVTGYFHNGKIEVPSEYQHIEENTPVRVEIPEEAESPPSLHPEVEKLVQSLHDTLGGSYSYRATEKSDNEIFAEAVEDSEKYGK